MLSNQWSGQYLRLYNVKKYHDFMRNELWNDKEAAMT
jgi:hypothetical protein